MKLCLDGGLMREYVLNLGRFIVIFRIGLTVLLFLVRRRVDQHYVVLCRLRNMRLYLQIID